MAGINSSTFWSKRNDQKLVMMVHKAKKSIADAKENEKSFPLLPFSTMIRKPVGRKRMMSTMESNSKKPFNIIFCDHFKNISDRERGLCSFLDG